MRRRLKFISALLLFVAALGVMGCFHHTADQAAEALRDAVKRRAN